MTDETGYAGPAPKKELENVPDPEDRKWMVLFEPVAHNEEGIAFVRIELDGETIGMLRLPNNEHVVWLKGRIQ